MNPHFGADDLCLVFDRGSGELMDASRTLAGAEGNGLPAAAYSAGLVIRSMVVEVGETISTASTTSCGA